ncbi:MAG: hypothetical protein WAM14_27210 [Candidatus Nitrosopolaris sp.]
MPKEIELHADIIEYPKDNTFVARCLEVPVIIEAETFDKAAKIIQVATKGYFETFPDEHLNGDMSLSLARPVGEYGKRSIFRFFLSIIESKSLQLEAR